MRKAHLDRRVAALLGVSPSTATLISSTFLVEVMEALVEGEEVVLDGFGTFTLKKAKGHPATLQRGRKGDLIDIPSVELYRIGFRKSAIFRERIKAKYGKGKTMQELGMEKLGVDEGVDQDAMEKAAASGCPECGAKCERHGSVMVCPTCGTAPFERK